MSRIKNFSKFINESLVDKNYIISNEDANLLYELEEYDFGPTDEPSDEDYNNFIQEVVGKTLWEYSVWRYPDSPYEQLESAMRILGK